MWWIYLVAPLVWLHVIKVYNMGLFVRYFQNFSLSVAPHLYICFRYAFADQCTRSPSQTRGANNWSGSGRNLKMQSSKIVSTARVDLEDKDTCLSTFSIVIFLSWGVCIIHENIRRTIAAYQRRLFHSISYTAWPSWYAMQGCAALWQGKCLHIW